MAKAKRPPRPPTDKVLDLPAISLFRQHDRIEQINEILRWHDLGIFRQSAGLVDEILTDPRIAGIIEQRIAGLMASDLTFEPADDRRKSKRVAEIIGGKDKMSGKWRSILPQETLGSLMTWGLFLGVAVAQIIWRRFDREWLPYLYVWHPHQLRWDDARRTFVMSTNLGKEIVLPRPDEQPEGDGQWFVWCPYGVADGWKRGLIRSLALPYLSRTWNERDWDRHNERQGMAILKAKVPGTAQDAVMERFWGQLSRIGSESTVLCPQGIAGPDGVAPPSYDVEAVEFTARTWEAMEKRKGVIDVDVAIRVLGQNLTTEVQGGSLAASRTHDLVRLDKALFDSEIGPALRSQVLTHWANWNFDDPELAPWPTYNVQPPEDKAGEAMALKTLGEAVTALTLAEPRVDGALILEAEGVPMITEDELAALEAEDAADAPPPVGGDPAGVGDGTAGPPAPAAAAPAALSSMQVRKRYEFAGLPLAIEYPEGAMRHWTHGPARASVRMAADYGFIEGYLSGDGEELDAYVGADPEAKDVFIVHQLHAPEYRAHDEDKIMLGFPTAEAARSCFLAHRGEDGERALGGITSMPLERFKAKLRRRKPESTAKIHASQLTRLVDRLVTLTLSGRPGQGTRALRQAPRATARKGKYHERLIERSTQIAARALAPDLLAVQSEIENATSLPDAHRRAIKALRGMDPTRLAQVIARMNILGRIAGGDSARQET